MTTKRQIPRLRAKRTLTLLAILLVVAVLSFATGWRLSPSETTRGYSLSNQDGYSTGYNDGQKGADPNPTASWPPRTTPCEPRSAAGRSGSSQKKTA